MFLPTIPSQIHKFQYNLVTTSYLLYTFSFGKIQAEFDTIYQIKESFNYKTSLEDNNRRSQKIIGVRLMDLQLSVLETES